MAIQTFSRYEQKYLLSDREKKAFLFSLQNRLVRDEHCQSDGAYHVYNIYYDTIDNDVVRKSIEKPRYKEKLRLRTYRMPVAADDIVYLEIKKKSDGKVNKRRIPIRYREAVAYVAGARAPEYPDYLDNQVRREIDWFLSHNPVRPNYFIGYERIAYHVESDPRIRITFDSDIRMRSDHVDFADAAGDLLLPSDRWLMEIKSVDNYPLWLAAALSRLCLYSQGFSKYGVAYAIDRNGAINHVF